MCGYDVGVGEEVGWRVVYEETVGTKDGGINTCESRFQAHFSSSTIRICTAHTQKIFVVTPIPVYCENIGQACRLNDEL
jgi:hypothetical protein